MIPRLRLLPLARETQVRLDGDPIISRGAYTDGTFGRLEFALASGDCVEAVGDDPQGVLDQRINRNFVGRSAKA